jgi:hypothetical protein
MVHQFPGSFFRIHRSWTHRAAFANGRLRIDDHAISTGFNGGQVTACAYFYAGLRIVSEFEIPEWSLARDVGEEGIVDVNFALRELPATSAAEDSGPASYCTGNPSECSLWFRGVASFNVSAGSKVCVQSFCGAVDARVRAYLLGPVWQSLCLQRNRLVLHGSAVGIDGHAVMFIGPAGSGKSVTAMTVANLGYQLLSDDKCDCLHAGREALLYSSPLSVKLWRDSVDWLAVDRQLLRNDPFRNDKYHMTSRLRNLSLLPVHTVVALQWAERISVSRLGAASFETFLQGAAYQSAVINATRSAAAYTDMCVQFFSKIRFLQLCRPRDMAAIGVANRVLMEAIRLQ